MRPRGPRRLLARCRSSIQEALVVLCAALAADCYDGHGPLEPPPGSPGGLCREPDGLCDQEVWRCEPTGRYCYDPLAPCSGVFCGEHGICEPDKDGLPACTCDPGYSNAAYSLYCDLP